MTTTNEQAQIARLREAGDEALAEVIAQHRERLHRSADLRLDPRLSGRVDAADVLQEVFLEASKRLSRFLSDPSVPVYIWLRRLVLETVIHVHRRHLGAQRRDVGRERRLHRGGTPQASSLSLAACLVGDLTSPSQAAIRAETARLIEEALDSMDEIDREVLILRHFEQLSNDEVAAVIGCHESRRQQPLRAGPREIP